MTPQSACSTACSCEDATKDFVGLSQTELDLGIGYPTDLPSGIVLKDSSTTVASAAPLPELPAASAPTTAQHASFSAPAAETPPNPSSEAVANIVGQIVGTDATKSAEIERKKRPRHARRPLTDDELCRLLAYLEQVDHGFDPRWVLLILVILQTGIRISDALCLNYGLFFRDGKFQGEVVIPGALNKGSPVYDYTRRLHPRAVAWLVRCYDQAVTRGNYHAYRPIFSAGDPAKPAAYHTARRHMLRILRAVFDDVSRLGSHSFRKSGARIVARVKGFLAANSFLNHACMESTRIYLGLEDNEVNEGCIEAFDGIYDVADQQSPQLSPKGGKPAQMNLPNAVAPTAPSPLKMSWEKDPEVVDADEAYFAACKMREALRRRIKAKRKGGSAEPPPSGQAAA